MDEADPETAALRLEHALERIAALANRIDTVRFQELEAERDAARAALAAEPTVDRDALVERLDTMIARLRAALEALPPSDGAVADGP